MLVFLFAGLEWLSMAPCRQEDGSERLTFGLRGAHLPGPGLRMLSDTLHRSRWHSQLDSCHCPRTPGALLRSHLQAPFLDNAPVLELLGPPASAKNRSYLQRELESHSLWQRLFKKKQTKKSHMILKMQFEHSRVLSCCRCWGRSREQTRVASALLKLAV